MENKYVYKVFDGDKIVLTCINPKVGEKYIEMYGHHNGEMWVSNKTGREMYMQ